MEVKTNVSFSKKEGKTVIELELPRSWGEITQGQLHYICVLMAMGIPMTQIKVYALIRMAGFDVINKEDGYWNFRKKINWRRSEYFSMSDETILAAANQMSFLDEYPSFPIRVERFGKFFAFNDKLHGLPFKQFITLENYWQGFISTKKEECIIRMTQMLYKSASGESPKEPNGVMCASAAMWYATFKKFCVEHWPNFFKRTNGDDKQNVQVNMEAIMNAEIRALTGGDVTKEKEVMELDTWRALQELDAKAKEADEQRRELAKIKSK